MKQCMNVYVLFLLLARTIIKTTRGAYINQDYTVLGLSRSEH